MAEPLSKAGMLEAVDAGDALQRAMSIVQMFRPDLNDGDGIADALALAYATTELDPSLAAGTLYALASLVRTIVDELVKRGHLHGDGHDFVLGLALASALEQWQRPDEV